MILLLGGSGFIGGAFRSHMDRSGIEYLSVRRSECNYCEVEPLDCLIQETRPELLINTAGFAGVPNVDACEWKKAECLAANAVLPGTIRQACERRGLPWGHVSSGCIYSGNGIEGKGFRESDLPNFTFRQGNCSFYSGCKALAEEILEGAENCYVWRLRIPFTHVDGAKNYLSKLMRYERLLDVRNSLSSVEEFVAACLQCWSSRLPFGTYNLTNTGSITTREIVEMIRRSGRCEKVFRFFECEQEFMRTVAVAPRSSCVLDNSKARDAGIRLSQVTDAIERSLGHWQWDSDRLDQQPLASSWPHPQLVTH